MRRIILSLCLFVALPAWAFNGDYCALKAELTAGHPDTGAYNANHDTAATELNAINRDAPHNPSALLGYLMKTEFRNATIFGRIGIIAGLQPDPTTASFGNAPTGAAAAAVAIDQRMVSAAKAVLRLTADEAGSISTPLTNTELTNILSELDTSNAEVMSIAQRNAIIGLSQNQQSRVQELGLGVVNSGHVEYARSISCS